MKYLSLAILLFQSLSTTVFAQSRYYNGDTLHVLALSGLRLRDQPGPNAGVVATLPYGATVVAQEEQNHSRSATVDKLGGYWTKVAWQGKTGYVFDGYLSVFPAPGARDTSLSEYCAHHFKKTGKLAEIKTGEEESMNNLDIQYYRYRDFVIECRINGYYESFSETLVFDPAWRISQEELFLLTKAIFRKDFAKSREMMEAGTFEQEPDIMEPTRKFDKDYYDYVPLGGKAEVEYYVYDEVCYAGLRFGKFAQLFFIQYWSGC